MQFSKAPKGPSVLFCRVLFQKQEPMRPQTALCSANEASTADLLKCKEGEGNQVFLWSAWTWREKRSFLGLLFGMGETCNCSWCRPQIPYLLRSEIPPNSHQASFWRITGRQKASHIGKKKSILLQDFKNAGEESRDPLNWIYSLIYTSRSPTIFFFFPRKSHTH